MIIELPDGTKIRKVNIANMTYAADLFRTGEDAPIESAGDGEGETHWGLRIHFGNTAVDFENAQLSSIPTYAAST